MNIAQKLRQNAASGDSCLGVSEDMEAAANEIERLTLALARMNEPSQIAQATCPTCAGKGILYDPFERMERICETCRPVEAAAFGLRVIRDQLRHLQEIRVPVDLLRHLNKIEIAMEVAIKWAEPVAPGKERT